MFCPKCGEKVPDGVAFCPKCGNKFASKPAAKPVAAKAPAARVSAPAAAKTTSGTTAPSLDANAIIPLVLGIIALILAFQPWFSPTASDLQTSQYVANGANGISGFFGGSSTAGEAYRLQSTYTMLNIGDYGKVLEAYGKSGSDVYSMLTYVWAIPVIASAVGLVMAIAQRKAAVARIGFVLLAAVAAFMAYASMQYSGPIYPGLCCIASIATVVMVGRVKKA